MERNVVEIYKSIEEEQLTKADKLRKEFEAKMHAVVEEHTDMVIKFAESLSDEEFTGLMKTKDIDPMDKLLITSAYAGCHERDEDTEDDVEYIGE